MRKYLTILVLALAALAMILEGCSSHSAPSSAGTPHAVVVLTVEPANTKPETVQGLYTQDKVYYPGNTIFVLVTPTELDIIVQPGHDVNNDVHWFGYLDGSRSTEKSWSQTASGDSPGSHVIDYDAKTDTLHFTLVFNGVSKNITVHR